MSVKKFRFVSPGIFINEIDNSQLPGTAEGIGPVVIGRAERGPGMRPVTVNSFSEFVEMFGNPVPGGAGGDIWRDGNKTAPTYAAYAAQAWLRNAAPLTFIRLLGHQHDEATAAGAAGWNADGDAYGLFIGEREEGTVAGTKAVATLGDIRFTRKEVGVYTDSLTVTHVAAAVGGISVAIAGDEITVTRPEGDLTNTVLNSHILGAVYDDADFTAELAAGADEDDSFGSPAPVAFADGVDKVDDSNADLALAAVIYLKGVPEGESPLDIGLSGDKLDESPTDETTGDLNALVKLQGTNNECKLKIDGTSYSVNFVAKSKKHIRKVLNTNPTLTNDSITRGSAQESYFLGETFDSHLGAISGSRDASNGIAMLVKLANGSGELDKADQQQQAQAPKTGWVLSQHQGVSDEHAVDLKTGDYSSGVTKLFRLEGLDDGAWASSNIKIEISDVRAADGDFNPYGSFTVTLRTTDDSDMAPKYLERYSSVNLNPASSDYIARRIGDMKTEWSYSENRYRTTGQYPSMSRFLRVEMDEDVDAGVTDAGLIPFGFQGPPSPRSVEMTFDGAGICTAIRTAANGAGDVSSVEADDRAITALVGDIAGGIDALDKVRLIFPSQGCRATSAEGRLSSPSQASFGASSNEEDSTRQDRSYGELLRPWSANADNHDSETKDGKALTKRALRSAGCALGSEEAAGDVEGLGIVPNFTLDDLAMVRADIGGGGEADTQHAEWKPGSRNAGTSVSALHDHKEVLSRGFDSFCMPLTGGCDGVDITQKEPFSNAVLDGGSPTENYAYNTVKRAIDSIADPEVVECNLAVMPGINNEGLTGHLLSTCEGRADTLAVIDLKGDYKPNTDNTDSESARLPQVKQTVQALKDRRLNSSYGCAYFPWVQVRDTINDAVLWAPPSVVALGTMASSQRKTEVWFAPAGFNRGGLTEGSAGLPVSQVRYRLTSKERDALYEANINPIATFPSEGIVVFGQKTLQVTPSALDRINVRRLMIFLKKEVSRIAATILFDQNTSVTWQRFTSQVEPFLASVKSRFGLSDFKVILDETTTTPDLVDRNILYAKIMLKPAKAIEFIALDFVITRSGASFED